MPGLSRADLARKLGASRARITQVLNLLYLAPEVVETIAALGDPLPRPFITERSLRLLWGLPSDEQIRAARRLVPHGEPGRCLKQ